jgi:hypothetical protein
MDTRPRTQRDAPTTTIDRRSSKRTLAGDGYGDAVFLNGVAAVSAIAAGAARPCALGIGTLSNPRDHKEKHLFSSVSAQLRQRKNEKTKEVPFLGHSFQSTGAYHPKADGDREPARRRERRRAGDGQRALRSRLQNERHFGIWYYSERVVGVALCDSQCSGQKRIVRESLICRSFVQLTWVVLSRVRFLACCAPCTQRGSL